MAKTEIAQFRAALDELISQAENADLTTPFRKSLQKKVLTAISDLQELLTEIDPVKPPEAVLDPSDPDIVGRFIGIGLIAQDKIELSERKQFYGSGIYAIYYSGRFPLYSEISGTETPIYVGRAIPDKGMGRTPREQGAKLDARIHEHRKNIIKADETLSVADFKYRTLVVASGWEKAAEFYLINCSRPYGIKKLEFFSVLANMATSLRHDLINAHHGTLFTLAENGRGRKCWSMPKLLLRLKARYANTCAFIRHFWTRAIYLMSFFKVSRCHSSLWPFRQPSGHHHHTRRLWRLACSGGCGCGMCLRWRAAGRYRRLSAAFPI